MLLCRLGFHIWFHFLHHLNQKRVNELYYKFEINIIYLFEIQTLAPGITVFGLAFLSLFTASLLAKDRETAFLQRLYTTPLSALDFVVGYTLPLLPIAIGQSAVCYLVAFALGLEFSVNVLLAILSVLPIALLFIGLGVLFGSILNTKQVGGICGALLTNLTAWL